MTAPQRDTLEVGLVVLHSKPDFIARMHCILGRCASKTLHEMISALRDGDVPPGTTRNRMRESCKYANRWHPLTGPNAGKHYAPPDPTKPTAEFSTTLTALVEKLPLPRIVEILGDNNEFRTSMITIKAARLV